MQAPDILQTIAEVAVSLLGFTGVVAVLGHRGSGHWSPAEILQLRTLVEPSLIVLFGSLLPGILELAFDSDTLVWRLSAGALALLGILGGLAFLGRARTAFTTWGQRVLLFLTALGAFALLLAAFGVLAASELLFVLGLVLGLVVAVYNFLLLLLPVVRGA